MTNSNQTPDASSPPTSGGRSSSNKAKTTIAGVAIAALLGGYTMFRPAINDATGWNLPAVTQQQRDAATSLTSTKTSSNSPTKSAPNSRQGSPSKQAENTKTANPADTMKSGSGTQPTTDLKRGPLAGKFPKSTSPTSKSTKSTSPASNSTTKPKTPEASQADPSLKYGVLREVGRERYISPAGLLYTPGSAEGHRLEHLRRHVADQPSRPGKHGVFDGGMEGALASIDRAYEKAKAGQRTTKETDGNRVIYTVDMGKRIGFVGGRDGNRQKKPMARRLRMVLEGNRVITAFPL